MRYTDMADELFGSKQEAGGDGGVRLASVRRGGVTVTRVEVARDGLARPRGRYVTLETPSLHLLDERDVSLIETAAAELAALLPPAGPVLVLGVGNRRVTADALGPRTVQHILVTMGHALPVRGIRPVGSVAPGVSQAAGISLQALAAALVEAVRPAALLCVDSLCTAEPERLAEPSSCPTRGLRPPSPAAAATWTPPGWACRSSRRASPP